MNANKPIGVFDSGIGGLTVLEELINQFPNEDFIYLADTAYCPYGIKTKEEIEERVKKVTDFLIKQEVKAIVIACNTATANAHKLIQSSSIPIVGVIEPTAMAALNTTKNGNIAVLATNLTIKSGIYQSLLSNKNSTVYGLPCSNFVPLAEGNNRDGIETKEEINRTLKVIQDKNIDTIVYGCTHFGLLDKAIRSSLPNAQVVSCGSPTARELAIRLNEKKIVKFTSIKGTVTLYTTGSSKNLISQIEWFKSPYQIIQHIEI